MSHHIYHARGVILGSQPSGESNRFYKIFTDELGLVGAAAQSVREGRSKLRYVLQDFSIVTVDLVRGKEVWRIVSAGIFEPLDTVKKDPVRLKLFANYCLLLSRLIQGEGRDQELYEEIMSVADFLEGHPVEKESIAAFEALSMFRVLVHLGYIDPMGFENFLNKNAYSGDVLKEFEKIRLNVLPKINDAIQASHL